MKHRNAYTLTEVCTAIVVFSLIMTLAATIVHSLMGASHLTHASNQRQTSLARLAEVFRGDVHSADKFSSEPSEGGNKTVQWILTKKDGSKIVYIVKPGFLTRRIDAEAGSIEDDYELRRGDMVSVETKKTGDSTLVSLRIQPPNTPNGAPGRVAEGLRADAFLGYDGHQAEIQVMPKDEADESADDTEEAPSDE